MHATRSRAVVAARSRATGSALASSQKQPAVLHDSSLLVDGLRDANDGHCAAGDRKQFIVIQFDWRPECHWTFPSHEGKAG
jgi:hypothetical protein